MKEQRKILNIGLAVIGGLALIGFIIGSLTEYIISYLGEIFFNVVWWDYSNMPVNLNGRICVFYSIFWGLLAIYLVSYINPISANAKNTLIPANHI